MPARPSGLAVRGSNLEGLASLSTILRFLSLCLSFAHHQRPALITFSQSFACLPLPPRLSSLSTLVHRSPIASSDHLRVSRLCHSAAVSQSSALQLRTPNRIS
ncbi:hypothetical protein VTN00DRAFT_4084 [Thermoascus crustaceus]|uniref:uncharacterized protein n=1 Tax=Thermoascus crustaceus TaxID=5088 RepID=UPI003743FCB8